MLSCVVSFSKQKTYAFLVLFIFQGTTICISHAVLMSFSCLHRFTFTPKFAPLAS